MTDLSTREQWARNHRIHTALFPPDQPHIPRRRFRRYSYDSGAAMEVLGDFLQDYCWGDERVSVSVSRTGRGWHVDLEGAYEGNAWDSWGEGDTLAEAICQALDPVQLFRPREEA